MPKLNSIEEKKVRFPDMPVDQAIKEGGIMAAAAAEDAKALTGVGLSPEIIAGLDASVAALRCAQAKMTASIGEMKESAKLWAEEEPKGYELRAEILAAAAYALRNHQNAMKAIKRVRQGSGSADMITDVQALVEIGNNHISELKAINFDVKILDLAAEKAEILNKLYTKLFVEKGASEFKNVRDRAFTYMRTIMGEVLDAAEYAFRKNAGRLDLYYSSYRSRKNGKSEPAAEEKNTGTK